MAIKITQTNVLSSSLAIQNYQGLLYTSLGFHGQRAILISGYYGFMDIAGQIVNLLGVSDKWLRKRTMWLGCIVLAVMLSLLIALSKFHGNGLNANEPAPESPLYSFTPASMPSSSIPLSTPSLQKRFPSISVGTAPLLQHFVKGSLPPGSDRLHPYASAAIHWKYYTVFISSLIALSAFCAAFLTETNQFTLESIAGQFGDDTISTDKAVVVMSEHNQTQAEQIAAGTVEERTEIA